MVVKAKIDGGAKSKNKCWFTNLPK